jgi:hypothetical protein
MQLSTTTWELRILGVRILRLARSLSVDLASQRAIESLPYEVRRQADEAARLAAYPRASQGATQLH